ncbi:hypothetical protein ACIQCR_31195 [Streptomyces sp. NPDC093249]|uniref:hypothetical protein n=1 Tax=unclassified Streptomyces TaxID=2593676 RepID=UPI00344FE576
MTSPPASAPNNDDLGSLTRRLLTGMTELGSLQRLRGSAADRLPGAVRAAGIVHQTSLLAGGLLAQAALSNASTTADGRQAVALLRHLTEMTTKAAALTAGTIAALSVGDTEASLRLLEQTRTTLARTPVTIQDAAGALLRHDGYLHAQDRAVQDRAVSASTAVKVTETQRKGLASLAQSDAVVRQSGLGRREVLTPLGARMRTSTIDALVDKDLVDLTPLPGQTDRYGVRLTSAGVRTLLAARPATTLATAVPVPASPPSQPSRAGALR